MIYNLLEKLLSEQTESNISINKTRNSLIITTGRNGKSLVVGVITNIGKVNYSVKVPGFKTKQHLKLQEDPIKFLTLEDGSLIGITQSAINLLIGDKEVEVVEE